MTAPKPVVTMDEETGALTIGGIREVGYAWQYTHGLHFLPQVPALSASELRAIADFLDQLAGANLLSEVTAG